MRIKNILREKRSDFVRVESRYLVRDVMHHFGDSYVKALLVTQEEKVQGIISGRDIASGLAKHKEMLLDTKIEALMSTFKVRASPNMLVEQGLLLLFQYETRFLPVFEEEMLLGILAMEDLIESWVSESEVATEMFNEYLANH